MAGFLGRVFMVRNSVFVKMTLFSNFGSTKGLMSFSVPQRADPYPVFFIPPEFLCVLAFHIDQQAEAHRAHNADEPVQGMEPRRKVGKGRADALAQAHQLVSKVCSGSQAVGRPQL